MALSGRIPREFLLCSSTLEIVSVPLSQLSNQGSFTVALRSSSYADAPSDRKPVFAETQTTSQDKEKRSTPCVMLTDPSQRCFMEVMMGR